MLILMKNGNIKVENKNPNHATRVSENFKLSIVILIF